MQLVLGQVAHAGVAGLHGDGQSQLQSLQVLQELHELQDVSHPHGVLQVQQDLSNPHVGQRFAGAVVIVGQLLQPEIGQAAIAFENEHVAIPTAIAAATVSFLIVIFPSLCLLEDNYKKLITS